MTLEQILDDLTGYFRNTAASSSDDVAAAVVCIAKVETLRGELQELRGQAILLENAQKQLEIQARINDELRKLVRELRADVERLRRDYHKRTN